MMAALIPADQVWTLWALMVAGAAFAIWLETRCRRAEKLSSPVIALLRATAISRGRSSLVLSALLAGLWGYGIGPPVGLMVDAALSQ